MPRKYDNMIFIKDEEIRKLGITPKQCVSWVKNCFTFKPEIQLPAKISVHPQGIDFFTAMPCLLPKEIGRYNVKVVSRISGRTPSLKSDSMLFDSKTGKVLAIIDSDYITTMRTGAVAALAVKTFKRTEVKTISFIGLGNTARATMLCLQEVLGDNQVVVRLLRYKNQAELLVEHFKDLSDKITFQIVETKKELFEDADVIISCITETTGLMYDDVSIFKPGVLIVPVHTRGFQNCDIAFDKVFCDDYSHVKGFKYFNQFKSLAEIGEVLRGEKAGRSSDDERILCYNVGLGLHDAYYCSNIYDMLKGEDLPGFLMEHKKDKYLI